jgi:hypothetical protein
MSIFIEDRIAGAKLRTLAPISQNTFQTSDLITIANDELLLKVVSDLMKVREDFFLTSRSSTLEAGVDHYSIPPRAIGSTLVALFYVDSSGTEHPLDRIEPSRRHEFAGSTGTPSKFYFAGDEVVICPAPEVATGSLLFQYYRKPNRLISTTNCAAITDISSAGGTTTITIDTDLTDTGLDFPLSVGSKVDIVSATGPFLLWAEQVSLTAISTTQIQVATSAISNEAGTVEPQIGDYVCPAGYSNIPMIPEEFHPVLDQMMGVRLVAALGDMNKLAAAKVELKEARAEAIAMVKNRVQSSPMRVSARNGLLSAFQR